MDNYDELFSNSSNENDEEREIKSQSEENTEIEIHNEEASLDLNSFSSGAVNTKIKKKTKKKRGKERFLKALLTVFLIGIITVSIVAGSFLVYVFTAVDGTMEENLDDLKLNFTTTIYVENKKSGDWEEYQRLHGTFNRIWVSYDRTKAEAPDPEYKGIPQNLVDAFVAIEDKRFFDHQGVDWRRTASSFVNLFVKIYDGEPGGSTITQQLVRNLTDDRDRKISRKIREIMRARYLESKYAKDTIAECYLNTIAMGHGLYGVETAANYYFDKSVHELTLLECASLASITNSPVTFAPDSSPEKNKERRELVLKQMKAQKYITEEEYNSALAEEFKLVASREVLNEIEINSYFVDALISQVTDDLADKYGYEDKHASTNFYSGGYRIYATVDPEIQSTIDKVFTDSATYGIKGKNGETLQGSITVMDYAGNVLGLSGGIGTKDRNMGFNRAIDAIRQPGSTMKPIGAYAPAIEQDLISYSSIVNDTSKSYRGWTPVNWYKSYWGNITVQYALERSVNTIPVYLVNELTPQVSFDFLTKKLGITTLNPEDVDLSPLGMGGTNGGINTLESAAAFAIFGNGGLYYEPKLYTAVYDQHNEIVLEGNKKPTVAISEDTATVMNHLLQGVVYGAHGTGAGAASFIPNMKIYAKTGTSNNANDLWFVGGSPYYVASCWCGYDTQAKVSNSSIARKMWGAVMSKIHSDLEAKQFSESPYAVEKYYCTQSGQIATDSCPSKAVGWYRKSNIPATCKTHTGNALGAPGTESSSSEGGSEDNASSQTQSNPTESSATAEE